MAAVARAPGNYQDNLAGARARGTAHTGDGHGSPVITDEAKREVERFLNDPIYRIGLLRRFRRGEGGALEVWFWRWKLGDPKPAKAATDEKDRERFNELRAAVLKMIQERPDEHEAVEAQILGELPPRQLEAGDEGQPIEVERRTYRPEIE